jgi:tRNA threonylcarbamoyladenosine biosynthesis protein TsaE
MEVFETHCLEETYALGRELAHRWNAGDCVSLIGTLGAGKTAFVRGVAEGMGMEDSRWVSSPTFVIVQEYLGRVPIYHIDLYRLASPEAELMDLGLHEMLEEGVVLIEWANRADDALPRPRWQIEISPTGDESRRFELRRVD